MDVNRWFSRILLKPCTFVSMKVSSLVLYSGMTLRFLTAEENQTSMKDRWVASVLCFIIRLRLRQGLRQYKSVMDM